MVVGSNINDRQMDTFERHESSCGAWPFYLKGREKANQENALYIPMNTLLEALHTEAKRCSSSSTAPKSASALPVQFIKSQLIKKKTCVIQTFAVVVFFFLFFLLWSFSMNRADSRQLFPKSSISRFVHRIDNLTAKHRREVRCLPVTPRHNTGSKPTHERVP